jgi:hypothetical protein
MSPPGQVGRIRLCEQLDERVETLAVDNLHHGLRLAERTRARLFQIAQGLFQPRLSLNALPITDTELRLMAAAASMGLSNRPKNGYNTPAATGTPTVL